MGSFHAFRYPNFRWLWTGNLFAGAAQWIQQTTMGWVVYDLTGSGGLLGAMNSMRSIAMLLVMPFAGVTADRISRNLIIGASQVLLFAIALLLALDIALGMLEVWHLFAFTLLAGVANSFNQPARQTMIFDTVPRPVLPNAVALGSMAMSTTRAIGPMIGGALIVAFGAAANFSLQAIAYLCVLGTVLLIHLPPREPSTARRAVFRDMKEGYGFVFSNPQARVLFMMTLINPLFLIPLHMGVLPILAKDVFDGGASSLGIMLGALGAGGIVGALLTASLNRIDRRGVMQLIALAIYSLAQATFSLVALLFGEMWLALPFLLIAGAAESVSNTTNQTVLQLLAPDELRGRINAALQLSPMLWSLSVLVAGSMADRTGAPTVGIVFSMTGFFVTIAITLLSPRMRNLRLSRLREARGT
ncbi:MAG: MFS transporter [Dehalococcoidia bacterium]